MKSVLDMCKVAADRPLALLLRHAQGKPIRRMDELTTACLTLDEKKLAQALGANLRERVKGGLRGVYTATLPFCRETAEEIIQGAESHVGIQVVEWLDVGQFVSNLATAMEVWNKQGHEWVVQRLFEGEPVPGFVDAPANAARDLLGCLISHTEEAGEGVSVFVSHGGIILWFLALEFRLCLPMTEYPQPFEGVVVHRDTGHLVATYGRHQVACTYP